MADTYSSIQYHLVFSTKGRAPWIHPAIERPLWGCMATISRDHGMVPLAIGGVEDHVHLVIGGTPTVAPCNMARLLKGASSRWLRERFPELGKFRWQDGYGIFSVSRSRLSGVCGYVERQREHHQRLSFQDEYRALLRKHAIAVDERYLWG